MEKCLISEVVEETYSKFLEREISNTYHKRIRGVYNKFLRYSNEKKELFFTVEFTDKFLLDIYNIDVKLLVSSKNIKETKSQIVVHRIINCLCDVALTGSISLKRKGNLAQIELNKNFKPLLDLFVIYREKFNYSPRATYTMSNRIKHFLLYLESQKIYSTKEISAKILSDYFKTKISLTPRSIGTEISTLRRFFNILYIEGITQTDFSSYIPNIKTHRNLKVPQVWKEEDLQNLFNTIDKDSPAGKRDYAILLLVAHYGIRAVDIKELKLSNLDWNNNQINILQSKTNKIVSFPILHDVGWALADYLKNGRPKCDIQNVFITLNHPLRPFGQNSYALNSILQKRMREANINLPRTFNHGLHALRHTLASVLLSQDVPLETISSILGHTTSQSTGIYLHTNMIRLKDCVLDPEKIKRGE